MGTMRTVGCVLRVRAMRSMRWPGHVAAGADIRRLLIHKKVVGVSARGAGVADRTASASAAPAAFSLFHRELLA